MSTPLTKEEIVELIRQHPPGIDLGNGNVELYTWEDAAALTCEKLLNNMHEELEETKAELKKWMDRHEKMTNLAKEAREELEAVKKERDEWKEKYENCLIK